MAQVLVEGTNPKAVSLTKETFDHGSSQAGLAQGSVWAAATKFERELPLFKI